MKVPLFPEKDTPIDLNIKAFVGHSTSSQFHVFEATRPLPRFSLYIPCSVSVEPRPQGSVTFQLSERVDRVSVCIYSKASNEPICNISVSASNLNLKQELCAVAMSLVKL